MTRKDQEVAIDSLIEQVNDKDEAKEIRENFFLSEMKTRKQSEKFAWCIAGVSIMAVFYLMFKTLIS